MHGIDDVFGRSTPSEQWLIIVLFLFPHAESTHSTVIGCDTRSSASSVRSKRRLVSAFIRLLTHGLHTDTRIQHGPTRWWIDSIIVDRIVTSPSSIHPSIGRSVGNQQNVYVTRDGGLAHVRPGVHGCETNWRAKLIYCAAFEWMRNHPVHQECLEWPPPISRAALVVECSIRRDWCTCRLPVR